MGNDQNDLFGGPPFVGARQLARKTDPQTSKVAADKIEKKLTAIQVEVYAWAKLHPMGFTYDFLVKAFPQYGPSTVRTRCSELRDRGMITTLKNAEGKEVTLLLGRSKRLHHVWVAV